MKAKKWDFLLYVHRVLFFWFVLFVISLSIPDGGITAGVLAIGNPLFLLINIPLAVLSFVLKAKNRFSTDCERPIVVLSTVNAIVGILAWIFVILLLQSPKFGQHRPESPLPSAISDLSNATLSGLALHCIK